MNWRKGPRIIWTRDEWKFILATAIQTESIRGTLTTFQAFVEAGQTCLPENRRRNLGHHFPDWVVDEAERLGLTREGNLWRVPDGETERPEVLERIHDLLEEIRDTIRGKFFIAPADGNDGSDRNQKTNTNEDGK